MRVGAVFAALSTAGALSLTVAQTSHPFVGTWKVNWHGKKGNFEAALVLTEFNGTWQTFAANKYDPCVGRKVPVVIQEVGPTSITAVLKFSEALRGCRDSTVTITRIDANTASGTREAATLRFTRE